MRNIETRLLKSDDFYMQAMRALHQNSYSIALSALTTAIALDRHSEQALYARAVLRAKLGDNMGAVNDFSRVIDIAPQKLRSYFMRGIAFKLMGQLHAALADFSHILTLEPDDCDAYFQRAEVYADLGFEQNCTPDLQRAIADYDFLLYRNPEEASAYRNRGLLRAATGDVAGAIDDCRRYLTLGGGRRYDDQRAIETLILSLEDTTPR